MLFVAHCISRLREIFAKIVASFAKIVWENLIFFDNLIDSQQNQPLRYYNFYQTRSRFTRTCYSTIYIVLAPVVFELKLSTDTQTDADR